jgi:hypothetical protein
MGPKGRPDTKTYWPTDRRSQIQPHSTCPTVLLLKMTSGTLYRVALIRNDASTVSAVIQLWKPINLSTPEDEHDTFSETSVPTSTTGYKVSEGIPEDSVLRPLISSSSTVPYIGYSGNTSTGPLPSNDMGINTHMSNGFSIIPCIRCRRTRLQNRYLATKGRRDTNTHACPTDLFMFGDHCLLESFHG